MKKDFVEPEIVIVELETDDIMFASNEIPWEDEL